MENNKITFEKLKELEKSLIEVFDNILSEDTPEKFKSSVYDLAVGIKKTLDELKTMDMINTNEIEKWAGKANKGLKCYDDLQEIIKED
ncbi:hypothetical protein [Clostridium perfringens]|uniref:hypothetical protein n=1 Tax=Clostridium perfringens TaxID=1502 RepID=UPI00096A2848|nr:hypothetical protein [Clostridium perfringens]